MRWLAGVRERLRSLLFRTREEAEMDEELRFHLEMETEANLRRGMAPEEARRQAVLAFGGVEKHREEVRDARGLGWVEVLARDVRYALRGLRLNPLFTVTMVLTLALGIGATAAMFSVVDALLLRPLPYHDPSGLVQVSAVDGEGGERPYVGWAEAEVWREQSGVFQGALSHDRRSVLFTGGAEPKMLTVEGVTPNFEEVLGVHPALGRGLYPEDAEPGAAPVAVLDHAFWRSAFGADPAVIGHSIELDGKRYRIVGVMPEGFKFPEYATTELWMPIHSDGSFLGAAGHGLYFVGRIAPGSLERAQARADAVARGLAEARPREEGWSIRLRSMGQMRAGNAELRRSVYFLMGAVALLLLVTGVNATSLLLVRAWSRSRELAVRVALGASRRRVVGQLLTESVLLALLGGVAAALIALIALHAIRGIMPDSITFFAPYAIQMGRRTIGFTFAVAAATGLLTGVVPALRALRTSSDAATAGLTPYASHTPARSRLRRALVVAEVAISVVLLLGAGLLLHSFVRLVRVDPGFRVENLAVMQLNLPDASYPTSSARAAFLHRLEARLEAIPGVEGVAVNSRVPPNGGISFGVELTAEGAVSPAGQPAILPVAWVPPDFFPVLGVPIIAGRSFTAEDAGTDHAIINRKLAHFLWAGESPLGRRFRIRPDSPWLTVVGVVGDLKMTGPDDRQARF
ncbi:MAG TPA: ABC transporter permease, partial [Longimicrobiaceae bacterium]|nr:ABC transporter permease [Longimicrobiaceae bacterium]